MLEDLIPESDEVDAVIMPEIISYEEDDLHLQLFINDSHYIQMKVEKGTTGLARFDLSAGDAKTMAEQLILLMYRKQAIDHETQTQRFGRVLDKDQEEDIEAKTSTIKLFVDDLSDFDCNPADDEEAQTLHIRHVERARQEISNAHKVLDALSIPEESERGNGGDASLTERMQELFRHIDKTAEEARGVFVDLLAKHPDAPPYVVEATARLREVLGKLKKGPFG